MADTGLKYVASVSVDAAAGPAIWDSPNNIIGNVSNDGIYTHANGAALALITNYIIGTFSHGLNPGDTINGITCAVRRSCSTSGVAYDSSVRIVKNGVIGATEKASSNTYSSSAAWSGNYGGASDTWGLSLSGSDTIGLAFSSDIDDKHESVYVYAMRMTIYYTAGLPIGGAKARMMFIS